MTSLVFVDIDKASNSRYDFAIETELRDFGNCEIVVDVMTQDRVEVFVRGQTLIIALVWSQFSRRWFVDDADRDDFSSGTFVDATAQCKHLHLEHILDGCVPTDGVSIQREVANCHFALVAGGENHPTKLVAERHQCHATTTALQVLLCEIVFATFE